MIDRLSRVLVLTGTLGALACDSGSSGECPANQVINVGHRGTGVNTPDNPLPENTIVSFLEGLSEGAEMIELDVALSSDDVLVVMHDANIDRTTNGSGCVHDFTVAELQLFDAAVGTTLEGTGVQVPTLAEVLLATDAGVNIEVKVDQGSCPTGDLRVLAQSVVDAMASDTAERRFVVSSFDADLLSEVQIIDPDVYLALLGLVPADAETALTRGFQSVNLLSDILRRGDVESLLALGLDVTVWTENQEVVIEQRLSEGVTMIITDEPNLVESVRSDWCAKMGYTP